MDLSLCVEFLNLLTTIFNLPNPSNRRLDGSGGSDVFLVCCVPLHNVGGVALLVLGITSLSAALDSHWCMFGFWCEASSTLSEACSRSVTYQVWVSVLWERMYNTLVFHHFNGILKPPLLARRLSSTANTWTSLIINFKDTICGLGSPRFELSVETGQHL